MRSYFSGNLDGKGGGWAGDRGASCFTETIYKSSSALFLFSLHRPVARRGRGWGGGGGAVSNKLAKQSYPRQKIYIRRRL